MHGYGMKVYSDGRVQEGLWEEDHLKIDKSEIKSYNPNLHRIAQKIEVNDYLFKNIEEITKFVLNSSPEPRDNKHVRKQFLNEKSSDTSDSDEDSNVNVHR